MKREPRIWKVYPELKAEVLRLMRMGYTAYQLEQELGLGNSLIRSWTRGLYAAELEYRCHPHFLAERDKLQAKIDALANQDVEEYQARAKSRFKKTMSELGKERQRRLKKWDLIDPSELETREPPEWLKKHL